MNHVSTIGREIDELGIRGRVMEIVDRRVREALEIMANYDPAPRSNKEETQCP